MARSSLIIAAACALLSTSVNGQATAPQYGQCGGQGWTGPTTCPSGFSCQAVSAPYYSQCLPGGSPSTTPPVTTNPGTGGPTPTTGTGVPSTTLAAGYSFIRAVVDPNFHKYLRSQAGNTAGDAVLGDYTTASQFKITDGQLILNAGGTPLYATVESPADSSVKKLKMSWSTTPATSGKFVFSGDTLEWSNPSVSRPQNNAWLVCPDSAGNRIVYVNLGPYSYQTPAGCADQTIHAYTGQTAVP